MRQDIVARHTKDAREVEAGLSERARAAGFSNNAYVGICDITQGPHKVQPVLPEFRGIMLGGVPGRPALEAALVEQVLAANKAHWCGMWLEVKTEDGEPAVLGTEEELAAARAIPAPTSQQQHELRKLSLDPSVARHIAHARAIREVLARLDAEAEAQAAEGRAKAQDQWNAYLLGAAELIEQATDSEAMAARERLEAIRRDRERVQVADAARASLDALWRAACEAAFALGKEPPPVPIEGMASQLRVSRAQSNPTSTKVAGRAVALAAVHT